MIAYSHTLTILLYATSMRYSPIRQMGRNTSRMCNKCYNDSRNPASIAKLRSVNSEFWKSVSWCLSSIPIESAWNRSGSLQLRTGWHQSQLEMFRCSSDSRTSTEGSSRNMRRWLFHLHNCYRRQIRLTCHRKANFNASSEKTLGKWNANEHGKRNWHSGNWKESSPTHPSSSMSIWPSRSSSKQTRVDSRVQGFSISRMVLEFSGWSISIRRTAYEANRIMTLMIGTYWPLWKH